MRIIPVKIRESKQAEILEKRKRKEITQKIGSYLYAFEREASAPIGK